MKVSYMAFENVIDYEQCKHIYFRYAQIYTMISNCTDKCYEHTNPIIDKIFFSSLISRRNGFVLGTNIWISIFK